MYMNIALKVKNRMAVWSQMVINMCWLFTVVIVKAAAPTEYHENIPYNASLKKRSSFKI